MHRHFNFSKLSTLLFFILDNTAKRLISLHLLLFSLYQVHTTFSVNYYFYYLLLSSLPLHAYLFLSYTFSTIYFHYLLLFSLQLYFFFIISLFYVWFLVKTTSIIYYYTTTKYFYFLLLCYLLPIIIYFLLRVYD